MKNVAIFRKDPVSNDETILGALETAASIGKSKTADIQLNDWRCNGIHAYLRKNVKENNFTLIDLGSYYGTYHDGGAIKETNVSIGDSFFIGDQHLIIKEVGAKDFSSIVENKQLARIEAIKDRKIKRLESVTEKKHLEVSLFWGEQLLEVQTFSKGTQISMGNPKYSTFGITLEDPRFEKAFTIAEYNKNGQLILNIPDQANGVVWMEGEAFALDTIRFYKNFPRVEDVVKIPLGNNDRAQVEFGELLLSFQYVGLSKKITAPIIPTTRPDPQILKILGYIFGGALLLILLSLLFEGEKKEKRIEDIPESLRKIVYNIGVQNAKKVQQASIGALAKDLQGGRARSEEGKSKSKKAPKEQLKQKTAKAKKQIKKEVKVVQNKVAVAKKEKPVPKIDLDSSFTSSNSEEVVNPAAMKASNVVSGNTLSALTDGGYARGTQGLGAGGGGKSVGIGSLSGGGTGGGLGASQFGLAPSKGRSIDIPVQDEIKILGGLDPDVIAERIRRYLPQIQNCYEQGLTIRPKIKGKVMVGFTILGNGKVGKRSVIETSMNDSFTEKCIIKKIGTWVFPKPRGGGTVDVKYPFILMSNIGK